jgi:threonine/homoserine/homoserine lactone efflux protein
MNRTQKVAWFNLVGILVLLAISIYTAIALFVLRKPPVVFSSIWPIAVLYLLIPISIIFVRKKQSPKEVDADERDNLIKRRAVVVSFVSVWILLFAASIIPQLIVGQEGLVPAWLLPIINLGVLFGAMLVYCAAVIVQYGWGGKGEKNE